MGGVDGVTTSSSSFDVTPTTAFLLPVLCKSIKIKPVLQEMVPADVVEQAHRNHGIPHRHCRLCAAGDTGLLDALSTGRMSQG